MRSTAHPIESSSELDCMVYIETGPVAGVVRRLAEEQNVDLVVTNRGHLLHPFGKLRRVRQAL